MFASRRAACPDAGPPAGERACLNRRNAIIAIGCAWAAAGTASADLLPPKLFDPGHAAPATALTFVYRGWSIDASRTAHALPADKTVRAIQAQLDLVARQGLSAGVLARMRAAPIIVVAGAAGDGVIYTHGAVLLDARRLDAKKPFALFGLLQAYADRGLPGGLANPDIARFREQALAARVWPKTALMLQNAGDFFAATAAAYLLGATNREPYTRAHLRQTQPAYYQWLVDLFDRGVPR